VFISGILGGVNVNMQEADPGNGRNEAKVVTTIIP